MNRKQAMDHGKQLLALKDEEGNKMFDSLALFGKPRESGSKLYSIGIRDVKTAKMMRFWTTREVHRFLKERTRKSHTRMSLFRFIHRG